jgi:heme O synthase-like polyprenyltransferase|tara:strand:- start:872 stop:1066 length:195 start_codon:yes stop_codon:yes gene_type:complete
MGSAIFSTKGNIGTFLIIVLALTMGIASLGKKFLNHYYDKYIDVMYVTISRLSPLREINLDVYS